jgi:hypothetical protein
MTIVWEKVVTSEPVDTLARIVTSPRPHPRTEACSCGWEPGAFSRVEIPYTKINLSGRRSGRLVVLGKRQDVTSKQVKGWSLVCRCVCGNHVIARHRHVRHQSVRMCGECEATRKMCGAKAPARVYAKED